MITHKTCFTQGLLFVFLLLANNAFAIAQDSQEQNRLVAIIRQLDLIQSLTVEAAKHPVEQRSRYHFDYQRLSADLERVRNGIADYQTPRRAQPRDPVMIQGDYRQESSQTP